MAQVLHLFISQQLPFFRFGENRRTICWENRRTDIRETCCCTTLNAVRRPSPIQINANTKEAEWKANKQTANLFTFVERALTNKQVMERFLEQTKCFNFEALWKCSELVKKVYK
jgi:hypothetical protein